MSVHDSLDMVSGDLPEREHTSLGPFREHGLEARRIGADVLIGAELALMTALTANYFGTAPVGEDSQGSDAGVAAGRPPLVQDLFELRNQL
ncbi:hypothetical protein LRE75_08170 [Streptomyces sp. 372A]|uniref:hypothetical protein n=1 Tax=Streptomyces sp. SAS_281 TaxID=3412744 RepID=UPI00403CDBAD